MTYRLITHILAIQFKDTLTKHFNPHQFGVMTRGGCEIVIVKCVIWSLSRLNHFISLLHGFLILDLGFCILGAPMGSTSFVESFVVEALHDYLRMICSLFMLTNPQAGFAIFSLCYTQCPSYLFHIVFPSQGILQDYVEFNTHTIIMLEKLIGVGSFSGSISHLAHH
jgi:hypothetical protein